MILKKNRVFVARRRFLNFGIGTRQGDLSMKIVPSRIYSVNKESTFEP